MAGAAFSLASALNDLHERLKPSHQELIVLQQRASAHVLDVLEKIRAVESFPMGNGFAMPKTPHRKPLRTRRTSISSRVAPKRQTRSATSVAKKCSLTKKALANDENSSKSSEDPEKENVEVQLKTATKGARKKTAPVIKVVPVTPLSQSQGGSLPQSLRSGRQTRARAKAMAANPLPQTPPQSVSQALLFSSAKRTATPSKQLFSPYAKCSVQEKARAFESKEAISPMRAELAKSCNALQSEASAATPMNRARMTPVPPSPLQAASVRITERGTLTAMEVEEVSPRTSIKERRSTRASSAHLSTSEISVPLQPSASQIPEAPTKTVVPCLEEKNLALSVPEPAATPQKRVTRAAVPALTHSTSCEEVPEAVPGPSVAKPVMISTSSSLLSPSPAASDADDEEWVEVDATPKHTRLHPMNVRVGAAGVKKPSGARGLTPKMLGKDRPGPMPGSVRNVSATSSNLKVPFATPKQATPSKLVRPVLTNETRPSTVKTPYSEESSRKRHDSGASEAELQRKQEILRQKMDAAKKERELRLARVQAQREQREAQRREQEQQRQREAQQKELERLKQRAEFHQRKQSERSLNIDTLAAAVKRRAESPLVSTSKRVCTLQPNKTAKVARTMNDDKEAVKLVFGQPSTSLAQKAKLNNSLQQQAMLNSLSQSLRNQSSIVLSPEQPQLASGSESIAALVETTPAKPSTVLNTTVTLSAADKPAETHNETFTVAAPAGTEPKTPSAANSTFVRTSGPPRSSGYDITPHRSELPPEPNKNKDNYDIDDLNSGDETDDDEKPRKEVPLWARGVAMQVLISRQNKGSLRGLDLFGAMPVPVLDKIFKEKKKYFNKRTSSALWN